MEWKTPSTLLFSFITFSSCVVSRFECHSGYPKVTRIVSVEFCLPFTTRT